MSETPAILFFCKDCQKVVLDPIKDPKRYAYRCSTCKSDRVSFGSQRGVADYYHIKEAALEKMLNPSE